MKYVPKVNPKNYRLITVSLSTVLVCLLVYLRSLSCGFVNVDDPDYVLSNQAIRSLNGDFFIWAFTEPHSGWWMPLTWISFAVDYLFWGLDPAGYHLTNILFHAANTGLVVLIADRLLRRVPDPMSGPEGAGDRQGYTYTATLLLAGLLWGVHPLRVESVVWVSERKDVLNGLFSLGAVLCYLCYAEKQGGEGRGKCYYLASLGLFACSLMAKSVSVVLPVMLLVADWYPLGRLRQTGLRALMVEKIPFFVLSCAMAAATIHFASQSQYLVSYELFPLYERIAVSGAAIVEYCRLLLVPAGVIPLFMIPDPVPFSYSVKAFFTIIICLGIYLGRKQVWLPATWLAFIIPLIPVLAFFQNGDQAYAARFTYLPSVAPCIAVALIIVGGYGKLARFAGLYRFLVPGIVVAMLVWYITETLRLIAVWDNTGTYWSRVVEFEPGAQAYKERGWYHYVNGMYPQAIDDYSAALKTVTSAWRPYIYNIYAYRGEALRAAGRHAEAVQDFTTAIGMFPHQSYYYYRGLSLKAMGRECEAEDDLRRGGQPPGLVEWFWQNRK